MRVHDGRPVVVAGVVVQAAKVDGVRQRAHVPRGEEAERRPEERRDDDALVAAVLGLPRGQPRQDRAEHRLADHLVHLLPDARGEEAEDAVLDRAVVGEQGVRRPRGGRPAEGARDGGEVELDVHAPDKARVERGRHAGQAGAEVEHLLEGGGVGGAQEALLEGDAGAQLPQVRHHGVVGGDEGDAVAEVARRGGLDLRDLGPGEAEKMPGRVGEEARGDDARAKGEDGGDLRQLERGVDAGRRRREERAVLVPDRRVGRRHGAHDHWHWHPGRRRRYCSCCRGLGDVKEGAVVARGRRDDVVAGEAAQEGRRQLGHGRVRVEVGAAQVADDARPAHHEADERGDVADGVAAADEDRGAGVLVRPAAKAQHADDKERAVSQDGRQLVQRVDEGARAGVDARQRQQRARRVPVGHRRPDNIQLHAARRPPGR